MPKAVVDIITIVVVAGLYLFLFWVARAMRAHLGRPAAEKRVSRRLEVLGEGGAALAFVALDAPVMIGRSNDADLVIDDPFASDFHARVGPVEGGFRVQDLGSTNGTFVNGERLSAGVTIGPGDRIQIGQTIMGVR
jgi:hypothetical protein